MKHFHDTGIISGHGEEELEEVSEHTAKDRKINDDPESSLRHLSFATDVPYSTVRTIVRKDFKMKAFRSRVVQELKGDHQKRVEWAEEWLEKIEYNNKYETNILRTDEAIFKLNGKVNIHNAITWSRTNPMKSVNQTFKKEAIMVWCRLLDEKII